MRKYLNQYRKLFLGLFIVGMFTGGCKKFIEVDPPVTAITDGNVYDNDGSAISALMGIYTSMSNERFSGKLSFYSELSADNLTLLNLSAAEISYYQNSLLPTDQREPYKPWLEIYPQLYRVNAAIEGLTEATRVTSTVKQNLLGQAYFLRAFFYCYLTNFYGEVPLALTKDYAVNNSLTKSSVENVYNQIVSDLQKAQELSSKDYVMGDMIRTFTAANAQRVTPNYYAVKALQARVYLYQKKWADADAAASEVINNTSLYKSDIPLKNVFLKNSTETIWGLQPIAVNNNSTEADFFTLRSGDPNPTSPMSHYLSDDLMNTFQTGDQRKVQWTAIINTNGKDYPYAAKYKALSNTDFVEQSILMRLGEQYLIRAEARIQNNNISSGIADLNVLRDRATDKNEQNQSKRLKLLETNLSKEQALTALNYERRVELFTEVAHRWFDLKRSGNINAVMTPATASKGGTWSEYKSLYPIPVSEIQNNSKLTQNTGYPN